MDIVPTGAPLWEEGLFARLTVGELNRDRAARSGKGASVCEPIHAPQQHQGQRSPGGRAITVQWMENEWRFEWEGSWAMEEGREWDREKRGRERERKEQEGTERRERREEEEEGGREMTQFSTRSCSPPSRWETARDWGGEAERVSVLTPGPGGRGDVSQTRLTGRYSLDLISHRV